CEESFTPVDMLELDGHPCFTWQEAVEREVTLDAARVDALLGATQRQRFAFPASQEFEQLVDEDEVTVGPLARTQEAGAGDLELSAECLEPDLCRVEIRISNCSDCSYLSDATREDALMSALVSTHAVLHVAGGAFVSLLEPPPRWTKAAGSCTQHGLWP